MPGVPVLPLTSYRYRNVSDLCHQNCMSRHPYCYKANCYSSCSILRIYSSITLSTCCAIRLEMYLKVENVSVKGRNCSLRKRRYTKCYRIFLFAFCACACACACACVCRMGVCCISFLFSNLVYNSNRPSTPILFSLLVAFLWN